jgi:hypothetical protein
MCKKWKKCVFYINRWRLSIMLFKDKNLPFGAPQTLEFRNFPYVFLSGVKLFFFNFFNIAPLTCAFELTSSNSYCKHLSLRSTLSKYLENLDYIRVKQDVISCWNPSINVKYTLFSLLAHIFHMFCYNPIDQPKFPLPQFFSPVSEMIIFNIIVEPRFF